MPNLSGPMSLGVSSAAVRPVRGTVFTVSCCRPKNALTWRSEVQSSGEGDASKASGLRSPVALVAKRNLTMQSAMLSGAVWLMRSRSSPKPAPRQRDRRPRLRIALSPPSRLRFSRSFPREEHPLGYLGRDASVLGPFLWLPPPVSGASAFLAIRSELRAETARGEADVQCYARNRPGRRRRVRVPAFRSPWGPSLLFLNYFAANMDDWDPKVTNGFAAERDVIRFDNPGVGNSGG